MRLYYEEKLAKGQKVWLDKNQSHYALSVYRKKLGDKLFLFNGNDGEWEVRIMETLKKGVGVEVLERVKQPIKMPPLTLAFSPLKHQAMGFLIEKATELGVTHLQPILTERTIVQKVNDEKILANSIEASQQCERLFPPTVGKMVKLGAYLREARSWILVGRERGKAPSLLDVFSDNALRKNPTILIGPEGGFSDLEWQLLEGHSLVRPFSLGSLVLRAETAALAALSVIQAERMGEE